VGNVNSQLAGGGMGEEGFVHFTLERSTKRSGWRRQGGH